MSGHQDPQDGAAARPAAEARPAEDPAAPVGEAPGGKTKDDVPPGGEAVGGALSQLANAVLVAAPLALGYFAGIAYLDAYLSAFSISIHEFEAPLATIVAHSFIVFSEPGFLALLALTGALAGMAVYGAVLLRRYGRLPPTSRATRLAAFVVPLSLFAVFVGIKSTAEAAARTAAHRIWHQGTAIVIPRQSLKAEDNRLGVRQGLRLDACLKEAAIKHVIATPTRSYALCVIGREGFLLVHLAEEDRYLPLRLLSPCANRDWARLPLCREQT